MIDFLTVCSYHVTYAFQSESAYYSRLNVKEVLAANRRKIWNLSDCNKTRTPNHRFRKWTLNHLAKLAKWLNCVVSTYLYGAFDCMFYHVMYVFQSESTLCNCLNVNEVLAQNRRDIWSFSGCNGTRTHNHLVRKRKLSYLAKLAKWLGCFVSIYIYGASDYMFLSCDLRFSEWILTL